MKPILLYTNKIYSTPLNEIAQSTSIKLIIIKM